MRPYGHEVIGSYAAWWVTDALPCKPRITTAGYVEICRRAGRRRPKRVARAAARREIEQELAAMNEPFQGEHDGDV